MATMSWMRSIGMRGALGLLAAGLALAATLVATAPAQQEKVRPKLGYTDTPMLPGGKYRVHDGERPMPPVITPGSPSTQDSPGKPPSDAVVLFDGKDLSKWVGRNGAPAGWKVEDGAMIVPSRGTPGGGTIHTKGEFGDFQLHIEWAAPTPPKGSDQGRGNSGIELFGRYEIQVLDSYGNLTYPDGQAAAIYGQYPPLVNASRPPGEWQTYDIIFNAPVFKDGKVETPAYVTLIHNGVLVHNHTPLVGAVAFRALAKYSPHGPKGPIQLQDHGNPVRYRNIWIRELKDYDQQ
jgi:hypothetical protein